MIDEVSEGLKEVPELAHLGDSVLRKKAKAVSFQDGSEVAKKLVKVLGKYHKFSGVGAGLAAPQIGISKKVFVTNGKDGYEVYINPMVINYSDKTNFYRESCLSSRMFWGDVQRPETLEMKWVDGKGKERQETFAGFKARLIQHEYDHLLGIPYLDKAISGTIEYSGNVKEEKLREKSI